MLIRISCITVNCALAVLNELLRSCLGHSSLRMQLRDSKKFVTCDRIC